MRHFSTRSEYATSKVECCQIFSLLRSVSDMKYKLNTRNSKAKLQMTSSKTKERINQTVGSVYSVGKVIKLLDPLFVCLISWTFQQQSARVTFCWITPLSDSKNTVFPPWNHLHDKKKKHNAYNRNIKAKTSDGQVTLFRSGPYN